MLRKKQNQNLVLNQKNVFFFKKATEGRVRTEKAEKEKKKTEGNKGGRMRVRGRRERAEMTD